MIDVQDTPEDAVDPEMLRSSRVFGAYELEEFAELPSVPAERYAKVEAGEILAPASLEERAFALGEAKLPHDLRAAGLFDEET